MTVIHLHETHQRPLDDSDSKASQLRAFLNSVKPRAGVCHCGDDQIERGRSLINDYLLCLSIEQDSRHLSAIDCAGVLGYLAELEPRDDSICFGHSADEHTCGYVHLLNWLGGEMTRIGAID